MVADSPVSATPRALSCSPVQLLIPLLPVTLNRSWTAQGLVATEPPIIFGVAPELVSVCVPAVATATELKEIAHVAASTVQNFLIETMIIKPFKKSKKKAPLSLKETGATFTYHRNKARNITVMCLNTPDTKSKSYTERRFLASALSALLV